MIWGKTSPSPPPPLHTPVYLLPTKHRVRIVESQMGPGKQCRTQWFNGLRKQKVKVLAFTYRN